MSYDAISVTADYFFYEIKKAIRGRKLRLFTMGEVLDLYYMIFEGDS